MGQAQVRQHVADDALPEQVGVAVRGGRNACRSQRAGQDVYLSSGAVQHCRVARMLQQATVDERPDLIGDEIRLGVLVIGLE